MKVLIVDDTEINRVVLAMLLKRAGYETVLANGIEEGEKMFASEKPEVVLTDLHMFGPDDGIELARRLRATPEGAAAKIALITADTPGFEDEERLFNAIIEKPVSLEDFERFIGVR